MTPHCRRLSFKVSMQTFDGRAETSATFEETTVILREREREREREEEIICRETDTVTSPLSIYTPCSAFNSRTQPRSTCFCTASSFVVANASRQPTTCLD